MDSGIICTPIIKIKYLSDVVKPIKYNRRTGDWIDLKAAEKIVVWEGNTHIMIPLGIAVQLPEGYEAIIAPRSSTFAHWGILQTNSIGVIDESYCGDNDQWMFSAWATRPTVIEAGDRICQFRIIKHQPDVELIAVDTLGNKDRGGFGSTGVR